MGNVKLVVENGEPYYQRFLLDCTEKKLREEKDKRRQMELIQALSLDYNVVCAFELATGMGEVLRVDEESRRLFSQVTEKEIFIEDCLKLYVNNCVHEEDQERMYRMFSRENLVKELSDKTKYCANYCAISDGEMK